MGLCCGVSSSPQIPRRRRTTPTSPPSPLPPPSPRSLLSPLPSSLSLLSLLALQQNTFHDICFTVWSSLICTRQIDSKLLHPFPKESFFFDSHKQTQHHRQTWTLNHHLIISLKKIQESKPVVVQCSSSVFYISYFENMSPTSFQDRTLGSMLNLRFFFWLLLSTRSCVPDASQGSMQSQHGQLSCDPLLMVLRCSLFGVFSSCLFDSSGGRFVHTEYISGRSYRRMSLVILLEQIPFLYLDFGELSHQLTRVNIKEPAAFQGSRARANNPTFWAHVPTVSAVLRS